MSSDQELIAAARVLLPNESSKTVAELLPDSWV
jgi:hypothetical protein